MSILRNMWLEDLADADEQARQYWRDYKEGKRQPPTRHDCNRMARFYVQTSLAVVKGAQRPARAPTLREVVGIDPAPPRLRRVIHGLRSPALLRSRDLKEANDLVEFGPHFPAFREWAYAFVEALAEVGIPAEIVSAIPPEDCSRDVNSPYTYGAACRIAHYGREAMTPDEWGYFGHVGYRVAHTKGVKVTWGGDLAPDHHGITDYAHWQVPDRDWPVLVVGQSNRVEVEGDDLYQEIRAAHIAAGYAHLHDGRHVEAGGTNSADRKGKK